MAIVIRARGFEPLPTGEYRVVLTDVQLVDTQYGDQLKWIFLVPNKERTLVAYSTSSPSLNGKCMKWASALLNRPIQPNEEVNLEDLLDKSAIAVVVCKRREDGSEYNQIVDLRPIPTPSGDEQDPFE
jgi:hypothetical protein